MRIRPPSQREDGFTLVELLAAVIIQALILGAMSMAFIAMLRGTTTMNQHLARTGDARLAAQYIITDARNSSGPEMSLSDTSSCPDPTPPVAGTPSAVVRFNWTSTGSAATTKPNIVNYVLVSGNLLRRQCVSGVLLSDRPVASNVGSVSVTCSPNANCSGTPTSVTVAVTSTADGTGSTYQYSLTGTFRKLIGDGAPPSNPSFVFLTGIEQGVASPTNTGVFTSVTGATSADTSVVRNGVYSLKTVPTGSAAAYAEEFFPSTDAVTVARFAVRLSSAPSGDRNLVSLQVSAGNSAVLAYQQSSNKLGVKFGGSITAATTSFSTNTWYMIEMRANFGTNPRTLVWRINSVAQPNISSSESASTGNAIRFGTSNLTAYTAYFDDIAISQTPADYGFGDGQVLSLVPDGMGTHSSPSNFQNESGGSISSSSYQKLVDVPANSISDYIRQGTSSPSSYIEATIGDQGQTCVDGVSAAVAYSSSATGGNNGQTRIYDGSTITTVQSGDMSSNGTSLSYGGSMVTSAAASWSKSALNGLKARIGYSSDVLPQPRWQALTLEYNLPLISGECDFDSPVVNRTIVARSSGSGSAGTIRQGTGFYVYAHVTDPGSVSSGIASVVADVSSFDSGMTSASMSSGSWTVGGQSYNYRSSVLTADTPLLTGGSYPYSLLVADGAANLASSTGNTVAIEKYSDVILATSGLLGYWPLNDTSASVGTDTFTGTTGVTVSSRAGELNASWSGISGNSTTAVITGPNRLRRSGTGVAAYYASADPTSANYTVEADVYVASLLSNDMAGIVGRASTSAQTFYSARYNATNSPRRWELVKVVNGTSTTLGTYDQTLTAATSYRVMLEMSGSTIRLYVGGVERVEATDSSISAAGRGGVRFGSSSSSQTDTTGLQLDNWVLNDTSASVGTDTFTGTTGVTVSSRAGELNASWSGISGNSTTAVITGPNRLRRSGTGVAAYYASADPTSANYTVEADVYVASLLSNDMAGIVGRASTSAQTFYSARYNATNSPRRWELVKVVDGTSTTLGTYDQTLTAATSYRVMLEMSGSTIRLYVGGVERVEATDSSISAAGRGGVRFGSSSSSQTDTTGLQLDNWDLKGSPPSADDKKGSNIGTYNNNVMLNVAGALAGTTDAAAKFDGVDDYAEISRQIADDFTIEFWFQSSQGSGTNAQWWGNAGLVDAEFDGAFPDFGTSLRSDGKITAGVGTTSGSDTSIVSTSGGFNDGNWHHVVFRRTKSSGAITLHVDGASQGSATGTTVSLAQTPKIRFGSIQTGNIATAGVSPYLDGSIDEVAIYSSVIGTSTITDHYESGTGT